jgi:hypothetical protein
MGVILFFIMFGFLSGLAYVMYKRKIKPGPLLSATFVGIAALGIWKVIKENIKKSQGHRRY